MLLFRDIFGVFSAEKVALKTNTHTHGYRRISTLPSRFLLGRHSIVLFSSNVMTENVIRNIARDGPYICVTFI